MSYYDAIARGYDELYMDEQMEKWDAMKGLVKPGKILEVGCGTGIITGMLEGAITAVDSSREMLRLAKAKGICAEFILANAENLPFADKEFDMVVSVTVLQDLENPENAINEMKRVGKKALVSCLAKGRKIDDVRKILGRGSKAGKDEFWLIVP